MCPLNGCPIASLVANKMNNIANICMMKWRLSLVWCRSFWQEHAIAIQHLVYKHEKPAPTITPSFPGRPGRWSAWAVLLQSRKQRPCLWKRSWNQSICRTPPPKDSDMCSKVSLQHILSGISTALTQGNLRWWHSQVLRKGQRKQPAKSPSYKLKIHQTSKGCTNDSETHTSAYSWKEAKITQTTLSPDYVMWSTDAKRVSITLLCHKSTEVYQHTSISGSSALIWQ